MERRTYPIIPISAVGAIVIGHQGLLLVRREKNPAKGLWSVPGGIIKTGETQRDALEREVLEETGIQIEILDVLPAADVILHDSEGTVEFHYVWIIYLTQALTEEISYERKEMEARWFQLNELLSGEMPPEVHDFVVSMIERIRVVQNIEP